MVRVEDLMAAIQNGQSADDLAAEYAKALNEANARVKAEARATITKVADARAVVEPLVNYLQTYIPEMDLGEVTDADLDEAAKFLVAIIDELLAPQLKLLKMLDLDGETPKAKLNITRKSQTIDPIADFLKDMGL